MHNQLYLSLIHISFASCTTPIIAFKTTIVIIIIESISVSYTHLDVYKRQPSIFNSIGSVFPVLVDNSTVPLIILVPLTVTLTPSV